MSEGPERFAALALACAGVSRKQAEDLARSFGSLTAALRATAAELERAGLAPAAARRAGGGGAARAGEEALRATEASGGRALLPGDAGWPAAFDEVSPSPAVIFVLGALPRVPFASVVGARRADAYGLDFARALGSELAAAGVGVVSGGALGIDGAAHAGALCAAGATVAVLGCGIDVRYPPENAQLQDEIAARGALLSELPPGTPPAAAHFPRRNRLIAALGRALVVVRAAERSGSLVTAHEARKLGRPLLAVPGPAGDPLARGTNLLLREGARMCEGAADVLAAMEEGERGREVAVAPEPRAERRRGDGSSPPEAPPHPLPPLPPDEARVFDLLSAVPVTLDAIGRTAALEAARVSAALTRLELLGLAARAPGNTFRRQDPPS